MAVRDDWAPGEVLTSTDLNDTVNAKADSSALATWLVAKRTVSAASEILADNVFVADYEFYKFVLIGTASSDVSISGRLRTSAPADVSGANYRANTIDTGTTDTINATNGGTSFPLGALRTTNPSFYQWTLFRPNVAAHTGFIFDGADSFATVLTQRRAAGIHNVATAYAGFRIFPASGTITGDLYVYGMKLPV